eukprot:GGOE01000328.1.p1 GENE.GGOE01000328.1~~GGOE01000328.1.p1  ORF type:complete len:378 (+),score=120.82 GGOE01000328.1:41-1135(+)
MPDENTMIYWTGFQGDEEDDLGERCDQRERMFFSRDYWAHPNPFHLGPRRKNGDFLGVKVVKNRFFVPYLYGGLEERVRHARSITHDHLVAYVGCYCDHSRDETLLWQHHVQGASLETLLRKRRRGFEEMQVRVWLLGVLKGLLHLHEHGCVLGKLRASKVVLDRDGIPVLVDWACPPNLFKSIYTYKHVNVMAPEVQGGTDLGPAADVWSFGLLLIELLTGQPAFPASEDTQFRFRATGGVDDIDQDGGMEAREIKNRCFMTPDALALALCCLRKSPAQRPTVPQLLADPFFSDPAVKRQALLGMKRALTDRMARTQAAVAMAKGGEDESEEDGEEEENGDEEKASPTPPPAPASRTGCTKHT